MKKTILEACLILSTFVSHAQTTVGYTNDAADNRVNKTVQQALFYEYDNAGNIIKRYYGEDDSQSGETDNNETQPSTLCVGDASYTIYVSPSPTTGPIHLSIPKYTENQSGICIIVNTSNGSNKRFDFKGSSNDFDISNLQNGVYAVIIVLDNNTDKTKTYEVKIIKK